MTLETAIHNRWTTDARLTRLVPTTRFVTGTALSSPELPYVVLSAAKTRRLFRTSSGTTVEAATIVFRVWSESLDDGLRIQRAILQRFDRAEFTCPDGKTAAMRLADRESRQEGSQSWQTILNFDAVLQFPEQEAVFHG